MDKQVFTSLSVDELKGIMREVIQEKEMPVDNDEKPIHQNEAAKYLGITTQTLIKWRKTDKIPYIRIGKKVMYLKSQLIETLIKNPKLVK